MKKHLSTILLIIAFLTGLSLLIYPSLSNYWNSFHQSRAIASYMEQMAALDNDNFGQYLAEAEAYNRTLAGREIEERMEISEDEQQDHARYESLLDVGGTGIMGYIEIPSIQVSLPIYHGTSDGVLKIAVGHIEGTSLPVGGEGTHCALSGHRGLPSARLFTDLDKLVLGDTFVLQILDKTLTYEVDQILIVLPFEMDSLEIEEGKDLCTLVTCTPYGVNSHRLLVRGHRVGTEESKQTVHVTADALQIEPIIVASAVAVPMLLFLLMLLLLSTRKRARRDKREM